MLSFTMMNAIFTAPVIMDNPHFKEDVSRKLIFMETPTQDKKIREEAARNNEPYSEVLRRAVAQYYTPKVDVNTGTDSFRAPDLGAVPCGPLAGAVAEAREFVINRDVADELLPLDGDVWMRANGDSMKGAGVHNNMMVLVRPYGRKFESRGHIVAIQVINADECVTATIKRYNGTDERGHRTFIDGDGNPYELPADTVKVEILGRVVSVLGNLED